MVCSQYSIVAPTAQWRRHLSCCRLQWLLAALLRARQESATGRQLSEVAASAGVPPEDAFPGPRFRLIDQCALPHGTCQHHVCTASLQHVIPTEGQ